MKTIIVSILTTICSLAYSVDYAGGNITYKPTGIANEYEFTANLYVNCVSNFPGASINLSVKNVCGVPDTLVTLPYFTNSEISQICTDSLLNTTCNSIDSNALQGIQHFVYKGTFQFTSNCSEWTLSTTQLGRNVSVNTSAGTLYIETKLNNLDFPCNSSPFIGHQFQIPYVPLGQNIVLPINAVDPDGDSLAYSILPSLNGPGSPITYSAPFTPLSPMAGISFTSASEISFHTTTLGNHTLAILIEEYDNQGVLKGSVLHDFDIIVTNDSNVPPTYLGVSVFDNLNTNSILTGDTLSVGPNDEFCFEVSFSHPDTTVTLENFSNVTDILPGAVVTSTPGNPAILKICWDFDQNYTGHTFSVESTTNTCPVPGITSQFFHLNLPASINTIPDTIPVCTNPSGVIDFGCASPPLIGWNASNGTPLTVGVDISCNPCNSPDFLFTNDTTVIAYNFDFPSIQQSVFIDYLDINENILEDSTIICFGEIVTFTGPYPNYYEIWSNINQSFIQNSTMVSELSPTMLYYTANAYNICFIEDSTFLFATGPSVILYDAGAILIATPHNSYEWLINGIPITANSQTHLPLDNGDYSVIGYDIWNCSDTSNIITITTAGIAENSTDIGFNRTQNTLLVNSSGFIGIIQIFNLEGKLLVEQPLIESESLINLPDHTQIYIARILSSNGAVIAVEKL